MQSTQQNKTSSGGREDEHTELEEKKNAVKFKTCALKLKKKKKSVKLNCSLIQSSHVNDVRAVVNTHSPT